MIKYRFIRDRGTPSKPNSARRPIGCIAYELVQGSAPGFYVALKFGWSFCNPIDKWDRERGKRSAMERLLHNSTRGGQIVSEADVRSQALLRSAIVTIRDHFDYDMHRWATLQMALDEDYDLQTEPSQVQAEVVCLTQQPRPTFTLDLDLLEEFVTHSIAGNINQASAMDAIARLRRGREARSTG